MTLPPLPHPRRLTISPLLQQQTWYEVAERNEQRCMFNPWARTFLSVFLPPKLARPAIRQMWNRPSFARRCGVSVVLAPRRCCIGTGRHRRPRPAPCSPSGTLPVAPLAPIPPLLLFHHPKECFQDTPLPRGPPPPPSPWIGCPPPPPSVNDWCLTRTLGLGMAAKSDPPGARSAGAMAQLLD